MSAKKPQANFTELKAAITEVLRARGHFAKRPPGQAPSNVEIDAALRAEGFKTGPMGKKMLKPIAAALGVIVLPAARSAGWAKPRPAQRPAVHPAARADFLETYEWRRVRMEVLKRDGRKCACCGATPDTGAVMNVDHIKPRRLFPELALDLANLQVLCHTCNHGKGNWDMTDWRESAKAE